jgi:signal recognition particle receptor subunit beta
LVEISHRERVVRAKIIYYGPAAGGKTTNLVVLHQRADPKRRGEMVSVNSTQDRTILLDLLPMKTPAFRGYELRFQVIAVPGQRMYAASRKLLLNGADAVVFVANSAADRWEETLQSLREMNQNLLAHGLDPTKIPVVYQYNKRDLPEVTPMEAMDRTLNARHTASFTAVAIREEGVLETFAAALRLTMEDITTRFKLGAGVRNARSIEEWTAQSMRAMFDWSPPVASDGTPPARSTGVPAARAPMRPSAFPGSSAAATHRAAPAPAPTAVNRVTVKVPVARTLEGTNSPSAATAANDPQAAEALVDSYAQAAADLTSALEEMRDERDSYERRIADLASPTEAALSLLGGAPTHEVLKSLVMRMAERLGAVSGSLSLLRERELRPVILHGLQREPLFAVADTSGRTLASVLIEGAKPLVYVAGDPGPIGQVLEMSGGKITCIVTVPVRTPIQTLGLACFYLSPEAAAPRDATEYLERWGGGVALVLETAANRVARDRLQQVERIGLVGRLAEQAVLEMGPPLDRLFATLGRLRTEHDLPEEWLTELRGMATELTRAKRYRDAVLGFMAGQPPSMDLIQLAPVFHGVRAWTADSLERHSVRLEATEPAPADRVRADPFLLRSVLAALVERSEKELSGHPGGLIQLSSRIENGKAYIRVADNLAAVRNPRDGAGDYASWTLERNSMRWPLSFVHNVVQYFQGQWSASATARGNELTMVLPAQ